MSEKMHRTAGTDLLTVFSRESGYVIGGCGCCGSPWMKKLKNPVGHYECNKNYDIEWKSSAKNDIECGEDVVIDVECDYVTSLTDEVKGLLATLVSMMDDDNMIEIAKEMETTLEILEMAIVESKLNK